MSSLVLTARDVRRLAVSAQLLAGPRPRKAATAEDVLAVARQLGCLQIDPTATVARTQQLVLWSRLGRHDTGHLVALAEQRRDLFEYWAHALSYVLAEDFAIHLWFMTQSRGGRAESSPWANRSRQWLQDNNRLYREVLAQLRSEGPLRSRDIVDTAEKSWKSTGWTDERNVSRLLDFLCVRGEALVAKREGNQRLWDLAERCLPPDVDRTVLDDREVTRRSAMRAFLAMGAGTTRQVNYHFTRGRYPGLDAVVPELVAAGELVPVTVEGMPARDQWYLPAAHLPLLDEGRAAGWRGRTTLLSPFDNLICDRARTLQLWGFDFTLDIYRPAPQRKYGFYVLPVLHGDRLVGRSEPVLDRKAKVLHLRQLHWEPGVRVTAALEKGVRTALADLAAHLQAELAPVTL